MRKHAEKIGYFTLGAITVALLVVGYVEVFNHRQPAVCDLCHRAIHANSRVIIEIAGKRKAVCCARCAVTEGVQEHRPVHFIEATDYTTGNPLKPADAFFVDGSRKVLCDHDMAMTDESKRAQPLAFDRCSPGAYAFARRQDAETFARENGGVVVTLEEMMREVPR